jgi:hypothetical protein
LDDLIVEFTWIRSDYQRALRKSARVTIFQWAFLLVATVLAIFFHIVIFAILICIALWAIASYLTTPILAWNKVPGIREARHVTFNDEGITVRTGERIWSVPWSRVTRSKETSEYYLLFGKGNPGVRPFNKAVFSTPVDEARFRSLLRGHTKSALESNAKLDLVSGDGGK